MITLDFGAYYRGYCSDITRTFAVGEPDPKMKEIYNIVLSSQIKAINEIRPGMTVQEADALSRDYMTHMVWSRIWSFIRAWHWFRYSRRTIII